MPACERDGLGSGRIEFGIANLTVALVMLPQRGIHICEVFGDGLVKLDPYLLLQLSLLVEPSILQLV
jgi:hypothetical protein